MPTSARWAVVNSPKVSVKNRCILPGGAEPRPYQVLGKFVLPLKF